MTPTVATVPSTAVNLATALRATGWGNPLGPITYEDLPASVRPLAEMVDRMGNALAEGRALATAGVDAPQIADADDDPFVQVLLVGDLLASLATAPLHAGPCLLTAALHYYASRGEPNAFRVPDHDGLPAHAPALRDLVTLQRIAAALVETAECLEELDLTVASLLRDFVSAHRTIDPTTGLAILDRHWHRHPFGMAMIRAAVETLHLPADGAWLRPASGAGDEGDVVAEPHWHSTPWHPAS